MATQAGYKQLQPFQSGISRDLQFWAQDAGNKRREELAKDQFEFTKSEADRKRKDALYDKYIKPINPKDTKSSSLNEAQMRLIMDAEKKMIPLLQTMEDPNASDSEKIRARQNLQKIHAIPDRLALSTDYYTKQLEYYDEGLKSGKLWEDPELERFRKEGFKGMEFGLDDNYDLVVGMRDMDGDGVVDVQPFSEIEQGIPQWDFTAKFNEEEHAMKLAEKIAELDKTTDEGFTTKRTKGADPNSLETASQRMYYNQDGSPTAFAKSSLKRSGLDPTPENVEVLRKRFAELTNSFIDKIDSETTDQGDITTRMNANRLAGATGSDGKNVVLPAITAQDGTKYSNAEVVEVKNVNGKLVLEAVVPTTKSSKKTDFTKLQAILEDPNASDTEKRSARRLMSSGKGGVDVTEPGKNEKVTIVVKPEDESWIAEKYGIQKGGESKVDNNTTGGMPDDEYQKLLEFIENQSRTKQ